MALPPEHVAPWPTPGAPQTAPPPPSSPLPPPPSVTSPPPPASPLPFPPPSPLAPPSFPPPSPQSPGFCLSLVMPRGSILSVGWFDLAISLPVLIFIVFLLMRAKQSLRRLRQTGSLVMTAYYGLLWAVCIVNLFKCIIEMSKSPESSESASRSWNMAWLISRFSLVFLESSVVVFLFQGYLVSGIEALARTLLISGALAAADTMFKAILLNKFHIPLFIPSQEVIGQWSVWGFWTFHHFLFAAVYALILALPFTRYRDRLPARPAFYRYIAILLAIDVVAVIGSLLLGFGSEAGYCIHGASGYFYSALFPPLLYFTFLSDFFKDDDLIVEDAYYSEMKEAGYFDDGWD